MKKNPETQYKSGADYDNRLLADEINRTSSKTQSALLEAMEEHQVTVDGVTHPLPDPFVVLATQNPLVLQVHSFCRLHSWTVFLCASAWDIRTVTARWR